jgi:O-antigen ligase
MTLHKYPHWHRDLLVLIALVIPWINPFASAPSSGVIPLLLSWMMCACVVIAVSDAPVFPSHFSLRPRLLLAAWAALLVALLLLVPRHVDHAVSFGLVGALVCIGLMAFVGHRVRESQASILQVVALAWIIAASLNAVIGVFQYLDAASAWSPWMNIPFYKGDAFGNLRQRNQFGTLMSVGWLALWWWVAQTSQSQRGWLQRVTTWLVVSLLSVGVAISMSRTGMLLWLSVSLVTLLWCWQQKRLERSPPADAWWLSLGSAVAFLMAAVLMPQVALWVNGEPGASLLLRVSGGAADYSQCAGRGVLWGNALEMLRQHPWLGWGWAQTDYAHFMTLYRGERFCDMLDNAHDLPLHLAVELGVPFALLSVLLALRWAWERQPWRSTTSTHVLAWGLLGIIVVHSLLEYPLWYGPFQMTAGLAIGLLWQKKADPSLAQARVVMQPIVALSLACALFVGSLYAAWDFNRVSQIYKSAAARDPLYQADPMGEALKSWLFQNQAQFAKLTTTAVTQDNAQEMYDLANKLLSYSPEERVVQRLIDAALLLGKRDEAQAWQLRLDAMKKSLKRQG